MGSKRTTTKRSGMLAAHDDTAKLPRVTWEGRVSEDDIAKHLRGPDTAMTKLVDAVFKRPLTKGK